MMRLDDFECECGQVVLRNLGDGSMRNECGEQYFGEVMMPNMRGYKSQWCGMHLAFKNMKEETMKGVCMPFFFRDMGAFHKPNQHFLGTGIGEGNTGNRRWIYARF